MSAETGYTEEQQKADERWGKRFRIFATSGGVLIMLGIIFIFSLMIATN